MAGVSVPLWLSAFPGTQIIEVYERVESTIRASSNPYSPAHSPLSHTDQISIHDTDNPTFSPPISVARCHPTCARTAAFAHDANEITSESQHLYSDYDIASLNFEVYC